MRSKERTAALYFKEWRIHAGFSQEDVGEKLGVTASTVSRIETGKRDFLGSYLLKFAEICNCPYYGDPVSRPPTEISIDALFQDPDERERAVTILNAAFRHRSRWANDDHGGNSGNGSADGKHEK
jgi:transcriptional regulator with XRE-family HTH domain